MIFYLDEVSFDFRELKYEQSDLDCVIPYECTVITPGFDLKVFEILLFFNTNHLFFFSAEFYE